MNNLLLRTIWGALFIVILIGSFFTGYVTTAIVLCLFLARGLVEFYRFFNVSRIIKPIKIIGVLGGVFIYATLVIYRLTVFHFEVDFILIPLVFLMFFYIIFSQSLNPLLDVAVTFFSWIYLVLPFYLMFQIYTFDIMGQSDWVFITGLFILIWSNDSFAYLTGSKWGKRKLIERISPKKTWEGAIGGFLATIVFGIIYAFITNETYLFWCVAAIVISPISIIGDLIESRLKRLVHVKDSGKIIPGHGGVLDRFDAAIYATPFFYLLLILFF